MSYILILLIFLFNLISKFWKIGEVPPLLNESSFVLRLVSASLSSVFPLLLYFFVRKISKSKKLALLSALIFSLLPQTFIEGRVVSFYLVPGSFEDQLPRFLPFSKFLRNFFTLTSPEVWLFQNIFFYWGGVRETGLIFFSLLPFLLSGLFYYLKKGFNFPFFSFIVILIFISLSGSFPENRLIFLTLPYIAVSIARGILIVGDTQKFAKVIIFILSFFLCLEMVFFYHFYFVHYPKQIIDFSQNIKQPF